MINNNINTRPQVAFTGSTNSVLNGLINVVRKVPEKTANTLDIDSNNVFSRFTFVSLAMIFLLGARFFQARNADERREVATRDFSAVVAAVYAVPIIEKLLSAGLEKATGFAFTNKGKEVAYDRIEEWYAKNITSEGGIGAFCKIIDEKGGKLHRILKKLPENCQNAMKTIFGEKGLENNKQIIRKFKEVVDGSDIDAKNALKVIVENLTNEKNVLVNHAKLLKAIPKATSFLASVGLLGMFLPWFNIHYTRGLYKKKQQEEGSMPQVPPKFQASPSIVKSKQVNLPGVQKNVYAEFTK